MVLEKIVSRSKNAFIRERQILDFVLIVNEWIKYGKLGVLCILGIGKACDHVNWSLLLFMLRRYGIGEKWCN